VRYSEDFKNLLQIQPGINPYASDYVLNPNETFTTPPFIYTYTKNGKGQASRNLHQWALNYGIYHAKQHRQTLLNNWETTFFNFDEQKLSALFDDAKKLGVDLFLLDDGWFGNKYPRNSDNAGLGDWDANAKKLPNGLGNLVTQAEAKGVKFGIWLEPEMVNPKSELYEKHPDWILKLPNRTENLRRNQLVLDLSNPAVQENVFNIVDKVMQQGKNIAYIKWDCNRYMSNTYSPYLKDKQSQLYVDYVKGFYNVLQKVRAKYPDLEMMLCSGGGGRAEYGGLKYFQEFWPSDNTDAISRIYIQWGYSYFFPSATVCAHVTSWGKEPIKFRTDVASMGKLGFDIQVASLRPEELEYCQQAVQNFNRLQNLIGFGSMYRLVSPWQTNCSSVMYVDDKKSKAVLFAFNLTGRFGDTYPKIILQGLDPNKKYKVEEINIEKNSRPAFRQSGQVFSGDFLMKQGLEWFLNNAVTSSVLEITEAG
jgi:alpha-galactosidase